MLLIIMHHFTIHSGVKTYLLNLGMNRYLMEITRLGNLGVVIFIIITGYFSINSNKPFKLNKLIRLVLEVFFYSFGIYLIFLKLGYIDFNFKELLINIFPILFEKYWFITAYVSLYIITPFINKLLNNFNQKDYVRFLLFGFLILSLMHTFTTRELYFNNLFDFIFYYSIGGYLMMYKNNIFSKKKYITYVIYSCIILLLLSVLFFDIISLKISIFGKYSTYFFLKPSPLILFLSIAIFNLFAKLNIRSSKIINLISSCVFGIYLIHDNNYIRSVLWSKIFHVSNYVDSNLLILYMFGSVLLVFVVCLVIEFIRKNTIERLTNKILDTPCDYIEKKYFELFDKVYNKLLNLNK